MDIELLIAQLKEISKEVSSDISILSNASALLFESLDNINWCGFYLLEDNELILGPFQGKVACTRIPLSKGVCGYAASNNVVTVVDDVHSFSGHIACDSNSKSEIVLPLFVNSSLYGVLDIDSPIYSRFRDIKEELISVKSALEEILNELY